MKSLASVIRLLNAVATGNAHATLIMRGATLANVYTGEIQEGIDVAVAGERIAYVGDDAMHAAGPKTLIVDARGRFLVPGMADPHVHIDQFVMPQTFAEQAVLRGVTTLFSDPIDIVSACGYRGFVEFLRQSESAPARIFSVVPGGLPVDRRFSTAKTLTRKQERAALRRADVVGLGEVFSWTRVTNRDTQTMRQLASMLDGGHVINGHTAGASGKKLQAYVASGIFSCHEPIDYTQTIERLRLGMWVMIREGSIRRDLGAIVPEVLLRKINTSCLMFCSDGLSPPDMLRHGHIDHCVREAVRLGMNPVTAYTIASRNAFEYYQMGREMGSIAPGKVADIVVLDDLEQARVRDVYVGGRPVVHGGRLTVRTRRRAIPAWAQKTVRVRRWFVDGDFAVRTDASGAVVNTIVMKTEIITRLGSAELVAERGVLSTGHGEIIRAAAFDRASARHRGTVGFLEGMGELDGAIATTWAFHENDLVIVGSNESDMAYAANAVVATGGGMAVVRNRRRVAHIPLDFGGIVSSRLSFAKAAASLDGINVAMRKAGCRFLRPYLVPLFLPFLALPSVRLLHSGMVNVKSGSRTPVIARRLK